MVASAAIYKPLEEQQSSFGLRSYGAGARFTHSLSTSKVR